MPEVVGARSGFGYGWDLGEDGWKPGVDENFRQIDTALGLTIIDDALTAPPGSPANGDTYIPAASSTGAWASHDGKIAAYQAGTWYFYPVAKGVRALFSNHGDFRVYNGTAWAQENTYFNQDALLLVSFSGKPEAGRVILAPMGQATTCPANFAGTTGFAISAAASDAVINVGYRRGPGWTLVPIGTLTYATGGQTLTLSTQAAVNLLGTDVLEIDMPSPQDTTLADLAFTLLFKRT